MYALYVFILKNCFYRRRKIFKKIKNQTKQKKNTKTKSKQKLFYSTDIQC